MSLIQSICHGSLCLNIMQCYRDTIQVGSTILKSHWKDCIPKTQQQQTDPSQLTFRSSWYMHGPLRISVLTGYILNFVQTPSCTEIYTKYTNAIHKIRHRICNIHHNKRMTSNWSCLLEQIGWINVFSKKMWTTLFLLVILVIRKRLCITNTQKRLAKS